MFFNKLIINKNKILSDLKLILNTNFEVLIAKKKYIFVIGHMRSYSSLLCHILGNHEEIIGYAEMHQSYKTIIDLVRLKAKTYHSYEQKKNGEYILDKLLHGQFISNSIINNNNIKAIFIIREPLNTLKSIVSMNMQEDHDNIQYKVIVNNALHHYLRILKYIEIQSNKFHKPALIHSEKIITNSFDVLQILTKYLELSSPLSENYALFKYSGHKSFGDYSDTILTTKITKKGNSYNHIEIPDDIIESANINYLNCINKIKEKCYII